MHLQLTLAGVGSILTDFQLEKVPGRDFSGTDSFLSAVFFLSDNVFTTKISQVEAVISQHMIETELLREEHNK